MKLENKYVQYYPFILFFVMLVVLHFMLPIIEDDLIYSSMLKNHPNIVSYINNYYLPHMMGWSSRYLTDLLTPIMATYPIIWDFIDSLLFTLMAFLIPRLLLKDVDMKKDIISIVLVILFALSNWWAFRSAGYIATTLNYTWPFIFGIINIYLVKTYILDRKPSRKIITYPLIIFSLVFAVNMEICAFLVFGMYLYMIYDYFKLDIKKVPKSIWILLIMIVGALIFHKFSPGNDYRYYYGLSMWVGNYSDVTLFNKIDLATTPLYAMMLTTVDLIMVAFFALLAIYSYNATNKKRTLVTFIPVVILIVAYIKLALSGFNALSFAQNFAPNGLLSHGFGLKVMLILLSYIVVILTTIYGIYTINKHGNKKIIPLLVWIIILAFISQSVVGFAPSAQIWYFPLNKYPGRWWILFNAMMTFATAILAYDLIRKN